MHEEIWVREVSSLSHQYLDCWLYFVGVPDTEEYVLIYKGRYTVKEGSGSKKRQQEKEGKRDMCKYS